MAFKYCNIDPEAATAEELQAEISRMEKIMWDSYNLQYALKILLNSSYGVIGNKYFVCYDRDIAEAITLQGQNIILFSAKAINKYFHQYWFKDVELHEALGVTALEPIEKDMITAGDTDSCAADTIIHTDNGSKTIEELFNEHSSTATIIEKNYKQEAIQPKDLKVLNWDKELKHSKVNYIYRHKVTKAKWKLKTASGKEVIVTNDHSLVVFRDGKQLEVKPHEIQIKDKILSVSPNIY